MHALVRVLWVASLLPLAGCMGPDEAGWDAADCDTTQDSQGQKVVCNGNHFQYTLQGTRGPSTDTYDWHNDDPKARVQAIFQGQGAARVKVWDGADVEVYNADHAGGGQTVAQETRSGAIGSWKVTIDVATLQGQVVVTLRPA